MSKLNLSEITSGYNSTARINAAFAALEAAFDNTLSRDGSTPNSMGASLDMNSNRVINLGSPVNGSDAARWADITSALAISTAVPSQTGNSGRYLGTNGTSLSWSLPEVNVPQTAAETAAGVTPTTVTRLEGDVRRYGFVGDNTTNDYTAINNALTVVSQRGGGFVFGFAGKTSRVNSQLTVPSEVIVDLEGGTINFNLSGTNDVGFDPRDYSGVMNGTVNVVSSGSPGSQAGAHSPVVVGPLYGLGGTTASPAANNNVTGVVLRNLRLSTNKSSGGVGIQVMGATNNCLIENIEIPDSSTMFGGVHLDWGYVGSINSADIPASRTAFDGGTGYTTHPNNNTIRNIKVGILSKAYTTPGTGSDGVRLSGCYNNLIQNVFVESVTEAGFFHTAGDLGFEFADNVTKPFTTKGNRVENYFVQAANNGYGAFVDAYADNVDAVVYSELIDTRNECGIELVNFHTKGSATSSASAGFRLRQIRGAYLINCSASGHLYGVEIIDAADRVKIINGRYWQNRRDGVYIGNGTDLPEDCEVLGVFCDQNGQDAAYTTASGVKIENSRRTVVRGSRFGAQGLITESTQDRGITITDTTTVDAVIEDNHVYATAGSGIAYAMAGSTSYGILKSFRNNTADAGVPTRYSGVNIVPLHTTAADNALFAEFTAQRSSLTADTTPTAGTWSQNNTIWFTNPVAGGKSGTKCVSGGTPGTWKQFGAIDA